VHLELGSAPLVLVWEELVLGHVVLGVLVYEGLEMVSAPAVSAYQ
jgi:hypothetical protein